MDKTLLKAYIKTVVEEEVQRLLPKMLGEAINEIKKVQGKPLTEAAPAAPAKVFDRTRMAELLGIDYDRDSGTIRAGMGGTAKPSMVDGPVPGTVMGLDSAGNKVPIPADKVPNTVLDAINRDYSALVKKMKL